VSHIAGRISIGLEDRGEKSRRRHAGETVNWVGERVPAAVERYDRILSPPAPSLLLPRSPRVHLACGPPKLDDENTLFLYCHRDKYRDCGRRIKRDRRLFFFFDIGAFTESIDPATESLFHSSTSRRANDLEYPDV